MKEITYTLDFIVMLLRLAIPINSAACISCILDSRENLHTFRYAKELGVNNIRGNTYCASIFDSNYSNNTFDVVAFLLNTFLESIGKIYLDRGYRENSLQRKILRIHNLRGIYVNLKSECDESELRYVDNISNTDCADNLRLKNLTPFNYSEYIETVSMLKVIIPLERNYRFGLENLTYQYQTKTLDNISNLRFKWKHPDKVLKHGNNLLFAKLLSDQAELKRIFTLLKP
jgi:hypothetical protein